MEDRAGVKLEGTTLLFVDRDSSDIGGQQVRGELDARV